MSEDSSRVTTHWHQLDVAAVEVRLQTDQARGLTEQAAAERLVEHGPNELVQSGGRRPWAILRDQLTATMVVILLIAALISLAVGDLKDALVILVVVVLNAALGFAQEYRAERAMAALRRLAVPVVRVRRDGHVRDVSAHGLVPGDVMLLEAGNVVGADARVVESGSLEVQESALTGETEAVHKDTAAMTDEAAPVGDRRNMVHMGTVVTYGRGVAIVTGTGMRSELGRIATLLQTVAREPTPLQRRLDQLGRSLAGAALAVVGVIFVMGVLRGEALKTMFLTAVTMAVAAVPEGLPAVVTIALALGAQRMLRRQALVRRLSAVETLGSVTVICADKTGTLTENRMSVAAIELVDRVVNVDDGAGAPLVDWLSDTSDHAAPRSVDTPLAVLLAGAALCNDVIAEAGEVVGDPTEVAMARAAERFGLAKTALERRFPRVGEAPFDSRRKRMSTVHALPVAAYPIADALRRADSGAASAPFVVFAKGAVDRVLEVSDRVWTGQGLAAIDASWSARIAEANDRLAADGMRVLGVGVRWLPSAPALAAPGLLEHNLVFVGVIGMADAPRPAARAAVAMCQAAGIRPVMITGDHPLTARYVARELGIADHGRIVVGRELEGLSDEAVAAVTDEASIYARMSPEHKLRLVRAFQRRGHTVAMTGDGVNDAPALKKASIGIAMGVTGTDVSKEAADIVLLDDNFATIVAAVEEGRVIYDNIRKFVKYLVTTNSGELLVMAVAPLIGMPLPLLPLQILWINLATDGPTALMLGVEPAEPDVMRRPPTPIDDSIFSRSLVRHAIWVGLLMTAVCVAPAYWYWRLGNRAWQTMAFTVVALAQMAHVLAIRTSTSTLSGRRFFSNRPLVMTVAVAIALQFTLVYAPFAQRVFGTVALSAVDVATCVALASVVFVAVEIEKWRSR